ncbi:9652_t:CDS:2 [Entrophospora sp. SA101]|nr:9652_t:CDS:2 [Entrophospora sp. SA101]
MITLTCEINNIPAIVAFQPSTNYNIIDETLASLFDLEINTSYTKPENLPCMYPISEVTEIFVSDEPVHETALVLGWPWFQANVEKVDFQNKTFTLHDGTVIPISDSFVFPKMVYLYKGNPIWNQKKLLIK